MVRFNHGRSNKESCESEAYPISQGSTRKKKPVMLKPTIQISEKDVLKKKQVLPPPKDKHPYYIMNPQGEMSASSVPNYSSFGQQRPLPP
mmetsp:Transcript_8661/g.13442  ORF Transcript_8661/g.13442 Transcript_8661/m.13442 type:complete len:90 (+) Transcript_8661:3492-3761(+)